MGMGTVYLLNAYGTDNYKIGITKRDINKRIKQLQTGCPDEIVLIKKFDCEHYRKVEGWLHRLHAAKRVEGEWFVLEDSDIHLFESDCKKYNDIVQLLTEDNTFYN
jgi:hypothetical protein